MAECVLCLHGVPHLIPDACVERVVGPRMVHKGKPSAAQRFRESIQGHAAPYLDGDEEMERKPPKPAPPAPQEPRFQPKRIIDTEDE